jgi:TolB-like protein/Tfp pilus assembly protein PilF
VKGLGESAKKFVSQKVAPAKNRIAILPFVNISPNKDDEYFADGMTEELIATMSRISGLKVIARTSIMSYKDGRNKIDKIAKDLGVGTVLEGSVRKAGDRLRITVQLVDPQSSDNLWSESYDRELRDVFAVQSDISKTVTEALKVRLLPMEKARMEKTHEVNPEGFTLYLKGRFYWNERTRDGMDKAIAYFERAIKADPALAVAHSGLADCYNIMADYFWMPPDRAGTLATESAEKALEIDDDLAEAHASLALTLMNYSWEFSLAERELKRAIELRPSYAPAHHWYAVLMFYLRRYEDYHSHEKQAIELDPHSRVVQMGLANSLALLGRTDDAMERYRKLIEQNPDYSGVHTWKADVHAWLSEYDLAIEEAGKALNLDGTTYHQLNLARILAEAGKKEESSRILDDVLAHAAEKYVSPVQVGGAKLAMGLRDEGYKWLEKGLVQRDASLLYFGSYPWNEKYRSDSRWKEIDAGLNLPREP